MVKKIVNTYYKFFDEKLENGTLVVLIILMIILFVGAFSNYYKAPKTKEVVVIENTNYNNLKE